MVQSFIIEETKELIYDSESIQEWREKCEALGLGEQLKLANGEGNSPVPFEYLNTVSERVYETLCPSKIDYKKYNKTTIPLDVLSLIALSEKEGYFEKIEIWYDDKTPDPIAVGFIKDGQYSFKKYAIARWGDVIQPFDKLKDRAIKIFKNSEKIKIQSKISDYKHKLENIDINTERYFDAQAQSYEVSGF